VVEVAVVLVVMKNTLFRNTFGLAASAS